MRYALINLSTGTVQNVIELDADGSWPIPEGMSVEASETANIGDVFANGEFTAPTPTPAPTQGKS